MPVIDFSRIELIVLDVDGVLTDGRITLTPDGDEIKSFHVRDGSGMKYWKRAGGKLAIISGRGSPSVSLRARELDVDEVRLNIKNKLPALRELLADMNVTAEQTAVIGDDLTDLPMLANCGMAVAVADAVDELKEVAHYVTNLPGGHGCVREVIEMIMKGSGRWAQIMERYLTAAREN
jgi:3-deoxy-D-manno-octulosonate 8-phosphate phosphatase (KDO 8-P phosphatase)